MNSWPASSAVHTRIPVVQRVHTCIPLQLINRLLNDCCQLGEGGYAFVYLAKELNTAEAPLASQDAVAIKKVITFAAVCTPWAAFLGAHR